MHWPFPDHFSLLVRRKAGNTEWTTCSQQQPFMKLLVSVSKWNWQRDLDERLSNYFSVLMALYLWFLCLCLLTVIASPLLFIFNESLKNGAVATVEFILILFTIERTVGKTGLHVLKKKAKTVHQRKKGKTNTFGSVCMGFWW